MSEIYSLISRPEIFTVVIGLLNLATAFLGLVRGRVYFGTFVFYRHVETMKYFLAIGLFSAIGILLLCFGCSRT